MGNSCSEQRRENQHANYKKYSLLKTGIPLCDKLYRESQKQIDEFENLKESFEAARSELISITGGDVVTQEAYITAILAYMARHSFDNPDELSKDDIKVSEELPFLSFSGEINDPRNASLKPIIRFVELLEQNKREIRRLDGQMREAYAISKSYVTEFEKMAKDFSDFDKIIRKESVRKNCGMLLSITAEIKEYSNEMNSVIGWFPDYISSIRQVLSKKSKEDLHPAVAKVMQIS